MVIDCTEIKFYSEFWIVKKVVKEIMAYLERKFPDVSGDDIFELRLIFSELLINAVIHGNKKDISKEVHIIIELNEDYVSSIIRDEGNGFNYFDELERKNVVSSLDLLDVSGRGLQIVKRLVNDLEFTEPGNEVKFKKNFSTHI